ncbi:hypothetical protein Tco_0789770, partial [Tanacetum coccineum]
GFLDSRGGGEKKKKNDIGLGDASLDSHSVVTAGTNVGPSIFTAGTSSYTDRVTEVTR